MEEMNLDDVLNKAEDYETETAPGATSIGSEEFLRVAIQDIKPDLTSWDDIIPIADRELAIMEKARADAALAAERKAKSKSAALTSKTTDLAESDDADSSFATANKRNGAGTGKTKAQRSVQLKEKDIRLLVRGIQKFGDVRYRYDKVSQDAKLGNKNRTIVQQTADELINVCRHALSNHEDDVKAKAAAGDESKKHKAVLVTFRGASTINAETTVYRHDTLKILNECKISSLYRFHLLSLNLNNVCLVVLAGISDMTSWKIPAENIKSTQNWSVSWSAKDDSALLAGIWKHGFGSWDAIQIDEELGLKGKFFLEAEKKDKDNTPVGDDKDKDELKSKKSKKASTPGAVHLVRRGDYLLSVLRDSDAATRLHKEATVRKPVPSIGDSPLSVAPENGIHRPKKAKQPSTSSLNVSQKKTPASPPAHGVDKSVAKPVGKRKVESEKESESESATESDASVDPEACKEMLRYVKICIVPRRYESSFVDLLCSLM